MTHKTYQTVNYCSFKSIKTLFTTISHPPPVHQLEVRGSLMGTLCKAALSVLPAPLLGRPSVRHGLWRGGGWRRGDRRGGRLPGPGGSWGSCRTSEGTHGVGGGQGSWSRPLCPKPTAVRGSAAREGRVGPGVVWGIRVGSGCPRWAPGVVVGVQVVERLASARPAHATPTLGG